jgi:hypothetical protein
VFLHDKLYFSAQNKQDLYLAFRDELMSTINITTLQIILPVVTNTYKEITRTADRNTHSAV